MDYRDQLFQNYHSTHVLHRKGDASLEGFRRRSVHWRKTFGRFLPAKRDARILDAGCGDGAFLWWLQQEGFAAAEGVDISEEQIALGRRLGVNGLTWADLLQFLRDNPRSYDLVVLRDIVEHFRKDQIPDLLRCCTGAVGPEGLLVIQVPNAESPFFGRIRYGDFTHEVAFTQSSLSQLLRAVGWAEIDFYPTAPVVHSAGSFARFLLWKVVELMYRFLLFVELGRGHRIVTQGLIAVARRPKET